MTDGQRLYECLLVVRPTQFPEGVHGGDGRYVPRVPWAELSERTQWSQSEWERIAEAFRRAPEPHDGEALYRCVLKVNPMQRRVFTSHSHPRPSWGDQHESRRAQWHEIARKFLEGSAC